MLTWYVSVHLCPSATGAPDLWLRKAAGFAPPHFGYILFGIPSVKWYFETGSGHVRENA